MTNSPVRFHLQCTAEQFQTVRHDSRFRAIVKLARAANVVRACQDLLIEERKVDFPKVERIRASVFLFACATLFDAIDLAKLLGKELKESHYFKKEMKKIFRDGSAERLLVKLYNVRNQGVSHFTEESIPASLDDIEDDPVVFSMGEGQEAGRVYHSLADIAVLRNGFTISADSKQFFLDFERHVRSVADLSLRFVSAADGVKAETLKDLGFALEYQ